MKLVCVVFGLMLVVSCGGHSTGMDVAAEIVLCASAGGEWRQFPNSCADACGVTDETICASVITDGCDCGENKCWDGEKCQDE